MHTEFMLAVLTCLVGAAVAILIAAIPCAIVFHGRLTKIETQLRLMVQLERRVRALELGRVYLANEPEDSLD